MRRITAVLLGLVLVSWILIEVPVAQTEPPVETFSWKRTVNGWEHDSTWSTGPYVKPAKLHPAVVGSLQLLVSLVALFAFSSAKSPGSTEVSAHQGRPSYPQVDRRRQRRRVSDTAGG